MTISSVRSFLTRGNNATLSVFIAFALVLFVKCVLFNWYAEALMPLSYLWVHPWAFWAHYLPKLAVALFFASFVFLTRHKEWVILPALVLDAWIMANMVYIRSNLLLLHGYAFTMAGGMNGFWGSIAIFFEWVDIIPLLTTIALAAWVIWIGPGKRIPLVTPVLLAGVLGVHFASQAAYIMSQDRLHFSDFQWETLSEQSRLTLYGGFDGVMPPTFENTIVHTALYALVDYISIMHDEVVPYSMTEQDEQSLRPFFNEPAAQPVADGSVILIIVESLENWAYTPEVMPNLYRFNQTHPHLYASRIKSQIRGGSSGDGQMILNTGVLPLAEGATCFRYPYNEFPAFMDVCDSTLCVLPHGLEVWNQKCMSPAFKYDTSMCTSEIDTLLFERFNEIIDEGWRNIQILTMSSHSPFDRGSKLSNLVLDEKMPHYMTNYYKSIHTMDHGLGLFLDKLAGDSALRNTTILITGDHKIFHKEKRQTFNRYIQKSGYNCPDVMEPYIPLFIYSPAIEENVVVEDLCYQMDIYPTILHLLHCDTYYWKGFGVNILDADARQNRTISESEAYLLSEKLIRSNYFLKKKEELLLQ